jgi:TfoX/Sxy family transcriptional regulator of competence genes
MAYDEVLADRIRGQLSRESGFKEQKMFGGVGFMVDGNMVAGASNSGELMLRVGPDKHDDALSRPGARVFEMSGRPMKGWLLVSSDAVATDPALRSWLDEALSFARSLPAKGPAAVGGRMNRKLR